MGEGDGEGVNPDGHRRFVRPNGALTLILSLDGERRLLIR